MNNWDTYQWWGGTSDLPGLAALGSFGAVIVVAIVIVIIVLKGYALWHAAKRDEKWWFVFLLVINSLGLLELIYLIFVVKKWRKAGKSGNIGGNESGSQGSDTSGPRAN